MLKFIVYAIELHDLQDRETPGRNTREKHPGETIDELHGLQERETPKAIKH